MKNLDRDPGFLVMVMLILPFIIAVEVLCRVHDLRERLRR